MKSFFCFLLLLPFVLNGQSLYSGTYGEYSHKWVLKINPDSSINICQVENDAYKEYNGKIKKKGDLFNVTATLTFAQETCMATGDSSVYINIDPQLQTAVQVVKLIYPDKHTARFPVNGKQKMYLSIDQSFYDSSTETKVFSISAEHLNPIDNTEVRTQYEIGDTYCLAIYTEKEVNFNLIIEKNKIKKIGKGPIDNFTLTKKK